jgi:hypothetical protein
MTSRNVTRQGTESRQVTRRLGKSALWNKGEESAAVSVAESECRVKA